MAKTLKWYSFQYVLELFRYKSYNVNLTLHCFTKLQIIVANSIRYIWNKNEFIFMIDYKAHEPYCPNKMCWIFATALKENLCPNMFDSSAVSKCGAPSKDHICDERILVKYRTRCA